MTDTNATPEDVFQWLEDVTGDRALGWVRERNAETTAALTGTPEFTALREDIREVLDADDRIPYVRRRGEYLYNFWQDAANPRGLWRRTTLERYRTDSPEWELLIDVDKLAAEEGENWVWQGATVLEPGFRKVLVELSRGGADATVVREFDLESLTFVADGFVLPEAKSSVDWIDEDTVFLGTDLGTGTLTESGYPRQVRRWRRGTTPEEAELVFEGGVGDVAVHGAHDATPGYERDFIARALDFHHSELHLLTEDGLVRVDVPDDARASVHREWLLVRPRSAWNVGGEEHAAGSLLAIRLSDFLAGERKLTTLFRPDEHTSLEYHTWTKDHLLLGTLVDVTSRITVLTPGAAGWDEAPLPGVPEIGDVSVFDTDPDHSNEFFLNVSGFTQPATLLRGDVGGEAPETVKRAPAKFDTEGLAVDQHFAVSADGTHIPYFVIGRQDGGPARTLLTGYGGFEISLTPSYSAVIGRGWLARGGTYVVANLRGGGEYGPGWHTQAIRENRPKVYEDLAAVAADLVERGITTAAQLGVQGGSNGGLLTGVMLTRYPQLFGAVVSQVPLLDMRRYHLLLAGASWMAEYGDPDDPTDWEFLSRYSPYHNVHSGQNYPPSLFVTSTRDDRVHPGHARKMVAKMVEQGHDVRYHENIEGGHGAAADNEQLAFKWALVFAFLTGRLAD